MTAPATATAASPLPAWRGVFAAVVTPFDRDGSLDERTLRANLDMTVADGAHGLMVCGQYGEGVMMSDEEKHRVFSIATETVAGRAVVLAATGHVGTRETIELTRAARRAGVDGVMIDPPHFMLPNADEVVGYYHAIAEAVDLPIKLCNSPSRSGFDLTADVIERLLVCPSIVSIKHSGLDFQRILQLITRFGPRLGVFIGPARLFGFAAVLQGAAGFLEGLMQVGGRLPVDLYDAAIARDVERGVELQRRMYLLGEAVYTGDGTAPATTKDAMRLLGRPGGWPRPPLQALPDAARARLRQRLDACGLSPTQTD